MNEARKAVRKLKSNKSPGEDAIPVEMIRATDTSTMSVIHEITNIWDKEELPGELGVGVICPLHKKEDQLVCGNYRGITLLNTIYKILSNVLCERLRPYAEKCIGAYQAGFKGGRSTIDQIFTLRQILEKTREYGIDTYHLFID